MARSLPLVWGATSDEHERGYPADAVLEPPVMLLTRAVTVAAPAELSYRWLCQISVAPYSYDLLDNRGRQSPQQLTPGADELRVGQHAHPLEVIDVDPGRHWTGRSLPGPSRLLGDFVMTYAAQPDGPDRSRMICRIALPTDDPVNAVRSWLLSWGDLVMMRKQFLTLKALAERDARPLSAQ